MAVLEVFTFIICVAKAEAFSQLQYNKVEKLPIWPVKRVNILQQILLTLKKKKKKDRYSTYRSKRENGFLCLLIVLQFCGKVTYNDKDVSGDNNRYNKGDDFILNLLLLYQGSS